MNKLNEQISRMSEIMDITEGKKDACYNKVKSRYKVWPSAYASGALVKCRKVGAANWGGSNESISEDWQDTSWTGEKGQTVTLKQLLDLIEDYPIIQVPIEKVEKIIIKKDTGGIESDRLSAADIKHPIIIVVDDNNNYKYVLDGNHRANKAIDTGLKSIPAKLVNINKLPEEFQNVLTENQKDSLHKWFNRQGAPGKSKGWVDCNTCRKNASGTKTCKACGRKPGEDRKYPACRPTPASCGTPKKGEKWGKKSNESLNEEVGKIRGMMGLTEASVGVGGEISGLESNIFDEFPDDVLKTLEVEYGHIYKHNFDWNAKSSEFMDSGKFDGVSFEVWRDKNAQEEFIKNLDKVITAVRSDLLLMKRTGLAKKKLDVFEEL
jgi:hypothetical protein